MSDASVRQNEADVREILRRMDGQDAHMEEQTRRLGRIEEQVARTNGRVTKLEQWKAFRDGVVAGRSWIEPLLVAIVSGGVVGAIVALLPG